MAGAIGFAAPIASIVGGLFGKDTASNVQLPPQFNMPNMQEAAGGAFQGIQNLPATQYGQQYLPQYQQATQNLFNNPYAQQAQQGAQVAGQMGQAGAQNSFGAGAGLQQAGQSLVPYAGQIMNTAFDPQQALYGRTQHQLQDQTRASQAARGISMSPYGAGVENKAMSDFNIDWQNAQLGRQAQGAQVAGGLVGQAGDAIGRGAGLQNAAPGFYNAASAMPYNTAQGIGQGQQSALSNLFAGGAQAQGLAQQPIQDYLSYLGQGTAAANTANQGAQLGLNQAGMAFNQNQTLGAGLGSGLAGLGSQNNMSWLNSVFGSMG